MQWIYEKVFWLIIFSVVLIYLGRATCMNHTYDDMKKQIEQVSTSNESSTSTYTTQIEVKAETQYVAQYDESAYYYEEDHDGEELENVKTEDTYYNQPGT